MQFPRQPSIHFTVFFFLSDLSLECFEKGRLNRPLLPLDNIQEFQIIYNGSTRRAQPDNGSLSPDVRPLRASPTVAFARAQSPVFFPKSASSNRDIIKTKRETKKEEVKETAKETFLPAANVQVITDRTCQGGEKKERAMTARKSARKDNTAKTPLPASATTKDRPPSSASPQDEFLPSPAFNNAPMKFPAIDKPLTLSACDPKGSASDPVKFKLTHHHYVSKSGEAPGYYRSATASVTRKRSPADLNEAMSKSTATSAIAQCILAAFPKHSEIFQARLEGMKSGDFPQDGYLKGSSLNDHRRQILHRSSRHRDTKKFLQHPKPVLGKISRSEVHSSSAPSRPVKRLPSQKSPVGLELCPVHPDGRRKTNSAQKALIPIEPQDSDKEGAADKPISNLSCLTFGDLDSTLQESKRRLSVTLN